MSSAVPYLSVVATARNDNHGGNLLARMQAFVRVLVSQCTKYEVPTEFILVEWNPPEHRPRLRTALPWPENLGHCRVRIVEVPAPLHRRYAHAAQLPLFQMIAKNVGIRRARGEWVLATNIDILFSDELFAFLAQNNLTRGHVYRMDRYDSAEDIPADGSCEELLAYCRDHVIRINTSQGTFALGPQGELIHPRLAWGSLETEDIAEPDLGLRFGPGWYPPECSWSGTYRWAEPEAVIVVKSATDRAAFSFWIEPGPARADEPFPLRVTDESGRTVAAPLVDGQKPVVLPLPLTPGVPCRFTLHTAQPPRATVGDARRLAYRVFRPIQPARGALRLHRRRVFKKLAGLVPGGIKALLQHASSLRYAGRNLREAPSLTPPPTRLPNLHTTACGDFTLMARDDWFRIGGYPELEVFSLHLDQLLLYIAHFHGLQEIILQEPMRIYHIEHAIGSGWTPEGSEQLLSRMRQSGVPVLDTSTIRQWAREMGSQQRPLFWNTEHWGLANEALPEYVLGRLAAPEAPGLARSCS